MPSEIDKAMEVKIRALRQRYLKTLQGHADKLKELLILCQKDTFSPENLTELLSQAHHLAGNGAIFGFTDVSEVGMSLQDYLRNNPDATPASFSEQLSNLIDACNAALSSEPLTSIEISNQSAVELSQPENELPLVLVVDDDENIQNIIQEFLQDDARILTCANTLEILDLMRKYRPEIVLLDDQMPGGSSGLQMLEEIQALQDIKNTPVIMLTASDKADNVMRGLMAGAADYITKPFDPEKLAEKIRVRLERLYSQILIADDEEAVRELLKHKFINAGCKVTCVADGVQAWDKMQKQTFALVVLDCMMPGFDGMTILRMAKENPKLADTPIVLLTAKHTSSDIMEGLNTGAADYICKPFNPDEVVTRCVRLLKHQKD